MVRAIVALVMLLAGCQNPDSPLPVVDQPAMACEEAILVDGVLAQGTYHVDYGVGGMGGSTYTEIPAGGRMEQLRRVSFVATWGNDTMFSERVHLAFDFDEESPEPHEFEGPSPLHGSFELGAVDSSPAPTVSFRAPRQHAAAAGLSIAAIDQPIALVVTLTYECAV